MAEVIALARGCDKARVVWMMKWNETAKQLQPKGVTILTEKQFVIPGGGEFPL